MERYETILGQLPVGVFRSTLDGEFVDVNKAFVSLLDAESKEDVMATNATDLYVDPTVRQELAKRLEKEGVVTDEEIQITTLEGEERWVSATLTLTESGDDQYIEGISQDITERKQRARELQRQNERLERFASVISHDLQNPLNVAEGRIELAQQDCDSEHLGEAASAIERSQSLIDSLLTVAREGDQIDNIQSLALAEVIDSCWSNVETKDATIVIDTDQRIRADESKIQQLLENLFRNSTEHGEDSEITITVGDLGDGFYVADDGVGIPEEDRDDVFESGFSTSSGTGLGLAIVKEIADVHGWDISLTDSQDGGTRFEITDVN
jgi:PAS domain S-box-containing protein